MTHAKQTVLTRVHVTLAQLAEFSENDCTRNAGDENQSSGGDHEVLRGGDAVLELAVLAARPWDDAAPESARESARGAFSEGISEGSGGKG